MHRVSEDRKIECAKALRTKEDYQREKDELSKMVQERIESGVKPAGYPNRTARRTIYKRPENTHCHIQETYNKAEIAAAELYNNTEYTEALHKSLKEQQSPEVKAAQRKATLDMQKAQSMTSIRPPRTHVHHFPDTQHDRNLEHMAAQYQATLEMQKAQSMTSIPPPGTRAHHFLATQHQQYVAFQAVQHQQYVTFQAAQYEQYAQEMKHMEEVDRADYEALMAEIHNVRQENGPEEVGRRSLIAKAGQKLFSPEVEARHRHVVAKALQAEAKKAKEEADAKALQAEYSRKKPA
jgi:hypothetical protein